MNLQPSVLSLPSVGFEGLGGVEVWARASYPLNLESILDPIISTCAHSVCGGHFIFGGGGMRLWQGLRKESL